MELYNEPLYRKDKKTGRNDLCPCGSGKKYKKCCIEKDEHSLDIYISAHEYNFMQKENDPKQFSPNEIWELDPYELQQLKMDELNPEQLKAGMRKSLMLDYHIMAISFIKEFRKYFTGNSGRRFIKETTVKFGVKKITIGGDDEKFDDFLHELVMNMEMTDKKDMVEQVINLYFDQDSHEYNYALFLVSLHLKDPQKILDQIEKLATSGIYDLENLISLYFNLKKDFPGLALMAFRSVIAAFPHRTFDIDLMANDFDEFEEEPSLETYDILCDFFDEDDDEDSEHIEIIIKMKQELYNARKESAKHQKIIENIKQQQNTISLKKHSLEDTETDLDSFKNQINLGKRKIETLQSIIKNKQEAIKELKNRIPLEKNISKSNDKLEKEESCEIGFDISTHLIPKISIPEYSKEFVKCLENEDPAIGRKALASITGFTINDLKILKQTKKIKAIENYYSIKIGIHHRLLIEYTHNSPPKAQYLIHRKDLEKIIKKVQQSK